MTDRKGFVLVRIAFVSKSTSHKLVYTGHDCHFTHTCPIVQDTRESSTRGKPDSICEELKHFGTLIRLVKKREIKHLHAWWYTTRRCLLTSVITYASDLIQQYKISSLYIKSPTINSASLFRIF